MSPSVPTLSRRHRWRNRLITLVALVVIWSLLWDKFSWGNLLGGLLIAVVVLWFFPLPPVTFAGRLHPLGILWLVLRFLGDLVVASIQVAWLALRPGPPPRNAVVAVRLRVNSDLNLTLVGGAVSLVPGSLIVEADRNTGTLYVHVLGVENQEQVERFRQSTLGVEARLIRAFGSPAELHKLSQPPPPQAPATPQPPKPVPEKGAVP
jgi:multicomponent Na+:H+ antiporter subunit E